MAGGVLGQGSYGVRFVDVLGNEVGSVQDRRRISALSWSRIDSATSPASLTIEQPGELAGTLEPWAHRLQVYRSIDGEDPKPVWGGTLMTARAKAGSLSLTAGDPTVLLAYRRVRTHAYPEAGGIDVATMARNAVVDALAVGDPDGIVAKMVVAAVGTPVSGGTLYEDGGMVDKLLDTYGKLGLHWTALGARLLLGPRLLGPVTDRLDDTAFTEGLEVLRDGGATITHATVYGRGVTANQHRPDLPAGQVDGLGVIEGIAKTNDSDVQAVVDALAVQLWRSGYPTPRTVVVPAGAALSSRAPVTIEQLIPGVQVPVSTSVTGSEVKATQVLTKLDVTVGPDGEQVKVTLEGLGS